MAEFDITDQINAVLKQYTGDVMDAVDKAVDVCSKGILKEIRDESPRRTGRYAKGWRCKIINQGRGKRSARVYNETDYQLTHLLEKPHRKRGGKGQTDPHPHIAPAEEKWQQKFEQMCEEACKGK